MRKVERLNDVINVGRHMGLFVINEKWEERKRASKTQFLSRVGSGIFKLELPPEQRRIFGHKRGLSMNKGRRERKKYAGFSEIYEIVKIVRSSALYWFSFGREFNDRERERERGTVAELK